MRIDGYVKFNSDCLKEKGMLQYFWHSPSSKLPVRDVLGENKVNGESVGRKPEPHIEIGAENFIAKCYQTNIRKILPEDKPALILMDEALNFMSRARTEKVGESSLASQFYEFLHNLSEEFSARTGACVVLSLPKSEREMSVEDEVAFLKEVLDVTNERNEIKRTIGSSDQPRDV
jgi:hypothetical protein